MRLSILLENYMQNNYSSIEVPYRIIERKFISYVKKRQIII